MARRGFSHTQPLIKLLFSSYLLFQRAQKASLTMADSEVVEYHHYCPPGVRRVLASGTSAFIGEVDDLTILKYPLEPGGDMTRLEIEHKIMDIIGHHPRIIAQKGFTEAGLYLERAVNGTIFNFLTETKHHDISLQQRIAWCREVVEAVEHVHSKRVIHCDIQPTNILLDENLHIKLADFQGRYLAEDGEVIMAGWSGEPCRYFCPREDDFEADWHTDLFALGSTIYFIITGHEVFSDIIAGEAGWDEKVRSRFTSCCFPNDQHACSTITQKCWTRQYGSAGEVLKDISTVERLHNMGPINTHENGRGGLIAVNLKCIILYRPCPFPYHDDTIHIW